MELSQNRSAPVSDLLRAAAITASRLAQGESSRWIEHELKGYPDPETVPRYRRVATTVWYTSNGPWPPEEVNVKFGRDIDPTGWLNSLMRSLPLVQPVHELETWVSVAADGMVLRRLPNELSDLINVGLRGRPPGRFVHGIQVVALENIMESVRTKVLNWALELEAAGVMTGKTTYTRAEQKQAASIVVNVQHNFGTSVAINTGPGSMSVRQSSHSQSAAAIDQEAFRRDVGEIIHRVLDRVDQTELIVLKQMRQLDVQGRAMDEVKQMVEDHWLRETGRTFTTSVSGWGEVARGIGSSLAATALWSALGLS